MWVSAYNSSPILETLSANFPTIAFWDFNHWELRDAAIPYYEDLVRVGIVHKTPASAANKVNEVYQDLCFGGFPLKSKKQKKVLLSVCTYKLDMGV